MPLIQGPDGRLWVEIAGRGTPVTVIAHGLSSSSADIAGMAGGMEGTRVLFDFRGHGNSESPASGYDQAAMARDLTFVVARYAATHAVGVSMGAAAILGLMCENPHAFTAAALLIPAWIDGPSPDESANAHLASTLEREGRESVAKEVLSSGAVRDLISRNPVWEARILGQISRMNSRGMVRALREYPGGGPPVADPDALGLVRAPVLVLAHEGDPGHPAGVARRLGALLPNTAVRISTAPLEILDDMAACGRTIARFFAVSLAPAR